MINYVTYDRLTGELTGSFIQDIQPEHQDCYVITTHEIAKNWTEYKYNQSTKSLELFVKPVTITIPQSVPMLSARLVLLKYNLLTAVQSYVDSATGVEGEVARITWGHALTVNRNDDLVETLIIVLNKTPAEIDQMFIEASQL